MTLHQLAEKHKTDKTDHGYMPFYERYLPKNPKKLLEIGVLKGGSIKMWKEYFPDCEIHALDLFIENPIPDIEGVIWHKGNQCDWQLLDALRNEDFDVIIDDGSHNSRDQLITFFGLFNGKQYYIEDIHCADQEFYSQGLPIAFRANNIFRHIQADILYDCQSPIVLIENTIP
jgi:hypothetical protein